MQMILGPTWAVANYGMPRPEDPLPTGELRVTGYSLSLSLWVLGTSGGRVFDPRPKGHGRTHLG